MTDMKLPKFAVVYFHGMPFVLTEETEVHGSRADFECAMRCEAMQSKQSDTQALIDEISGVDIDAVHKRQESQ